MKLKWIVELVCYVVGAYYGGQFGLYLVGLIF